MAGCIEDLFTQYLRDFDRFKGLDRSPMKKRVQDFAHGGTSMLLLQHMSVADATYKRDAHATFGSTLRYSEDDFWLEVGIWEVCTCVGLYVGGALFKKAVEATAGREIIASGSESATIRPASRTRIRPNPAKVDARWDTTINVEVERYSDTLRKIKASDVGSRQEVASSRIRIRGLCRSAHAIASRWR